MTPSNQQPSQANQQCETQSAPQQRQKLWAYRAAHMFRPCSIIAAHDLCNCACWAHQSTPLAKRIGPQFGPPQKQNPAIENHANAAPNRAISCTLKMARTFGNSGMNAAMEDTNVSLKLSRAALATKLSTSKRRVCSFFLFKSLFKISAPTDAHMETCVGPTLDSCAKARVKG